MKFIDSHSRIALILVFLLPGLILPGEQLFGQLSLTDCHQKARSNYPLIKQQQLIELSRGYTVSNANKSFLPQLSLNLIGGIIDGLPTFGTGSESGSTEFNLISTVQFNQAIWDGGTTKANKQIIESTTEIDHANLEVSLYKIEDRVNNLFFGILLIDEQLRQLEIFKENLNRNFSQVQIAVENGTAFRSDIDEVAVEILNTDQQVSELEYNRSAYFNVLSALVGEIIDPEQELVPPELETNYEKLPLSRPELKVFSNMEDLYQAHQARQRSALYPKIGLTAMGAFISPGVGFGSSELDRVLVGGLSFSWDISALYTYGNHKKLTEIQLQKTNVERETFVFNVNLELIRIQEEILKYRSLIDRDNKILELKNSITKSYRVKYDNGVSTMSELLDKANEENIARQNLITHELQYLLAQYNYKNISGN